MKRLLIIVLFLFGCDNSTEPELEITDCNGVAGGSSVQDCAVCSVTKRMEAQEAGLDEEQRELLLNDGVAPDGG